MDASEVDCCSWSQFKLWASCMRSYGQDQQVNAEYEHETDMTLHHTTCKEGLQRGQSMINNNTAPRLPTPASYAHTNWWFLLIQFRMLLARRHVRNRLCCKDHSQADSHLHQDDPQHCLHHQQQQPSQSLVRSFPGHPTSEICMSSVQMTSSTTM